MVGPLPPKLDVDISYNLAIALLGIDPKEEKVGSQRDTCTLMFIATLFTIGNRWTQLKCPLLDE